MFAWMFEKKWLNMIDTVDGSEIPRPTTVWMVQKPPRYLPDQLVSRILSINRMFIFQAKVSGHLGLFFWDIADST